MSHAPLILPRSTGNLDKLLRINDATRLAVLKRVGAIFVRLSPHGPVRLEMHEALAHDQFPHCSGQLASPRQRVPVPPTWNKGEHHQKIGSVWARAAQHLSTARQIAIIGYSLPDSDYFFRTLWALGTVGPTRIERLWVINPAFKDDPALEQRYRSLLGEAAAKRFKAIPDRMEDVMADFAKTFFPDVRP